MVVSLAVWFTYWIMLNYLVAACVWAFQGDFVRSAYWLFAIGIMGCAILRGLK